MKYFGPILLIFLIPTLTVSLVELKHAKTKLEELRESLEQIDEGCYYRQANNHTAHRVCIHGNRISYMSYHDCNATAP